MPLNALLLSCLMISKTSYGESGAEISIQPKPGELILFFPIDDKAKGGESCLFHKELGSDKKICDCIVFYARQGEAKKTLCLVELKHGNLHGVEEKLTNIHSFLKARLRNYAENFELRACVRLVTGSTQNIKQIQLNLEKLFGPGNVTFTRDSDLGLFLRKQQSKGKQKTK